MSAAVAGAGAGAGALSLATIACASSESTDTAVTRGADVGLAVRLACSLVVWKVNVAASASWAMSLRLTGADVSCAEHEIASPTRAARSSVCILTMAVSSCSPCRHHHQYEVSPAVKRE